MLAEILPHLTQWGPAGLVVFAIVFGWLIPKRTHERELDRLERQADKWEQAHAKEVERGDLLARQVSELMELARSSAAVLNSLPKAKEPA